MAKALEGIRMIDWGTFQHGVAAGYMLGDLGAEIIKIEDPVMGDPSRGVEALSGAPMKVLDSISVGNRNVFFETVNRNKKGITLDLKQQKGKEVLYRLVEKSDVFYTNFRSKVATKLDVDYETLRQYNPTLIYAIASANGQRGPEEQRRAFDPIAMARTGLMWSMGDRDDQEPVQVVGTILDQLGATLTAYGILGALLVRERTGIGQQIEVSLFGGGIHLQAVNINTTLFRGRPFARHSRARSGNPLSNHYRCADDKWLILAEPQFDRFWGEFREATGTEELGDDPRFASYASVRENHQELIGILDKVFATKNREEWLETFEERKVNFAYGPVNTIPEVVSDPQALANEYIVDYDHPTMGPVKQVGFPVWFSETPAEIQREAPEFGQHTEEVLLEICGYTWEQISELRDEGVI